MKSGYMALIGVLAITILICGCISQHIVRNYTHEASGDVTIIIYKEDWQNLTVIESNSSEIKITESFYMNAGIALSDKDASKSSGKIIMDYVKFVGNNTKLTIYIDLRSSISRFETRNADAHIDIYIPEGTNYKINYVEYNYRFDIDRLVLNPDYPYFNITNVSTYDPEIGHYKINVTVTSEVPLGTIKYENGSIANESGSLRTCPLTVSVYDRTFTENITLAYGETKVITVDIGQLYPGNHTVLVCTPSMNRSYTAWMWDFQI